MELLLLFAFIYLFTFLTGDFLEKARIPWLFSALILGFAFSFFNLFHNVLSSDTFSFLGELGMYFLLFLIGLEINVRELVEKGRFYLRSTIFITLTGALFGGLVIYYLFKIPIYIAMLVGLSFATVGEAVLIPILEEFRLVKKPLGKAIIGIGILDDAFELVTFVVASVLVGSYGFYTSFNILLSIFALSGLFILVYLLTKFKEEGRRYTIPNIETLFVFVSFIFFLFIGIGKIADSAPLGALLAGIALKSFLPKKRLELIESEIKTMGYGLFAPIFFVWVGATTDISYVFSYPLQVFFIVVAAGLSKIIASWISARKEMGNRNSLLLGIGLCVRFSTSIVIIKYLFERNIIPLSLYSVLITSTALFTISIPFIFSMILSKQKRL